MEIRHTRVEEIDTLMEIFDLARLMMKSIGNVEQWPLGYPKRETILDDIKKGVSYVLVNNDQICATFSFIEGVDPTYLHIDEGKWLDNSPYATIHRVASNGRVKGVFKEILDFCLNKNRHIRIDTHKDNTIMRKLILKNGFKYCGIIYVNRDHSMRLAYERSDNFE